MASEMETVEQRSKSFISQLQTEYGILDRLVHKFKNQHRRCSYFQYMRKVRRDLKLLQSLKLEDIFDAPFIVINGNRPKQKVQLLESLKRRKCGTGKYNFLERLLGVTRLLSQTVEPLLKAAMEISTLLAKLFFENFTITTLAVLARIRVIVQQMLLDAVLLYNTAASICQKEQTVKLNQEGFEVFREYYPIKEEDSVMLECIWETDKYVLAEKKRKIEADSEEKDVVLSAPKIHYENIEVLLGVDESVTPEAEHNPTHLKENVADFEMNNEEPVHTPSAIVSVVSAEDVLNKDGSCTVEVGPPTTSSSKSQLLYPAKGKSETKKRVAFVSIKPSASEGSKTRVDKEDDPFFDLLTGGNKKSRLF